MQKRMYTLFILSILHGFLLGQKVSEPFSFQFEGKTLRGLIEKPETGSSRAVIMLIPGYGRTDFVEGQWFSRLRYHLVQAGMTVCLWDKMGCGKSEGTFDAQQPVENSAEEAVAAIAELQRRKVPGAETIGMWGLSRAGWIVPLINQKHPIDFWISVSGTDAKENFGYLVRSNLLIEGKSEAETEKLYQAWMLAHKLYCTGGSMEDYAAARQVLLADSLARTRFHVRPTVISEESRATFEKQRQQYLSKGHFDEESGLWSYIDDFDSVLMAIKCPVLALFGANDSQVDWRKTKALYEKTIATQPNADFQAKVFEQCNHSLQKCVSCAWQEDLSALGWANCDGYYETMIEWLRTQKLID
ncbi:MAG: CocE/NonD family hydrolase [Bacteroidota bacterium]